MIWFLVILFLVVLLISLVSRFFSSPYTLTFIFGKKGAGKTLLMVKMMLRDKRKGWHIYTDIQDVAIPGVRVVFFC